MALGDVTKSVADTLIHAGNRSNPQEIPEILARANVGTMMSPTKVAFVGLGSATAHQITDAAHFANVNGGGGSVTGPLSTILPLLSALPAARPGAGVVVVTGGTKPGTYILADDAQAPYDAGATSVGVATLSDDGTTITFATAATGFVLDYLPAPAESFSDLFIS